MLILVILLYVLMHFHIIYNIFWNNLLIQCHVPVFVYFVHALQKKVKNKSAWKIPEKYLKKYPSRKTPEARRRAGGGPPLTPSFGIYLPLDAKTYKEVSVSCKYLMFRRRHDSNLGIT